MRKAILGIGSALASLFGIGQARASEESPSAAAFGLIDVLSSIAAEPAFRPAAAQRGHGKKYAAQWAAGKVAPSYAYISRQVKRREQRKAMKRMTGAAA